MCEFSKVKSVYIIYIFIYIIYFLHVFQKLGRAHHLHPPEICAQGVIISFIVPWNLSFVSVQHQCFCNLCLLYLLVFPAYCCVCCLFLYLVVFYICYAAYVLLNKWRCLWGCYYSNEKNLQLSSLFFHGCPSLQ